MSALQENPSESAMTQPQERAWQEMLIAEFNCVFYKKKAHWMAVRPNTIRVVAGVVTGSAAAAFFVDPTMVFWSKAIAVFAGVLSLALTFFDLKGALVQVEEARDSYSALSVKLEQLWPAIVTAQVPDEDLSAKLSALLEEKGKIKSPNVGESDRLRNKAFKEVCAAHGLTCV